MFALLKKRNALIMLGFVMLLSYFTYVHNYGKPNALFWDENYHIASAQKYVNGIHFMEQHPPLGKLLIALGQKIVNPSAPSDEFIDLDYGPYLDETTSFAGYRLFPVLMAWLITPILYLLLLLALKNPLWATFGSFLYIFENSTIVHSRGAMLEPGLLFFSICTIFCFALLLEDTKREKREVKTLEDRFLNLFSKDYRYITLSIFLGLFFGLAMSTKVTALILVLLLPVLLIRFYKDVKKCLLMTIAFSVSCLTVFLLIWQIHFMLGNTTNDYLSSDGYYDASEQLKSVIDSDSRSIVHLPLLLRDSLRFSGRYNSGVPTLDLCKDDENGSPFFLWPVGARTIRYRWNRDSNGTTRYLFLVSNPAVYAVSFLSVVMAVTLFLSNFVSEQKKKLKQPYLLFTMLLLYLGYMGAMTTIDRVMYLYHYLPPLLFGIILFSLVLNEIPILGRYALTASRKTGVFISVAVVVFATWAFYQPLTYFQPISDTNFAKRALLRIWDFECAGCAKDRPLAMPVE